MSRRGWGTGHLYEKHGSYYGRWRTSTGRLLNRKVGGVRSPGEHDGLTRSQAEKEFRRLQEAEELVLPRPAAASAPTVDEVANFLRRRLQLRSARPSYLENCESMQRVHVSPLLGLRPAADVETADIEAVAERMLASGLAPKTVRNVLTFLHAVFEYALEHGITTDNPVGVRPVPDAVVPAMRIQTCSSSPSRSSTQSFVPSPMR